MQKEIPFSNINNTEYTNLINGFKVKPKIINKALSGKLNLFSDNENIKCKYYTNKQFKENDSYT